MALPARNLQTAGTNFADVPCGPDSSFRGLAIFSAARYSELTFRSSYYACTQHDTKAFDFEGRAIKMGTQRDTTQQPLVTAEKVPFYVPLKLRRPSSPYRLPRVITNAFTALLFGEDRFPDLRVEGDAKFHDFNQALARAAKLPAKMIQARNEGGSAGTVGLSWCFTKGKPRVRVHKAKHLFVHKWEDREELRPKYVTECYLYPQDDWDNQRKRYVRNYYWYRRDWTPNADAIFLPVLYEKDRDPVDKWAIDFEKSKQHNDGLTHFEWVQNLPSDDIDGTPDYEGLYENFDAIDIILSVITRGATLNLDPTLVLKLDADLVQRHGVKKGSDNALVVGEGGDAQYLELAGQSLEAGINLFNAKRRAALEVAQCVIPDPDEVGASGSSAAAMKVIYAPMTAKASVLREQYGTPLKNVLENMGEVARASMGSTVTVPKQLGEGEEDKGETEEVQPTVDLPPKVEKKPKLDDDGNPETDDQGRPTGAHDITTTEQHPGEGGEVELDWPPFFSPTPTDQSAIITALSTAVAAAPIMSTQTATEIAMGAFGRDPGDEVARVATEKAAADAKQADLMAKQTSMMGGPPGANGMPPGAKPKDGAPPGGGGPKAPKPPPGFGAVPKFGAPPKPGGPEKA